MILNHGIIGYKSERGNICIAATLFFGRPFSEPRARTSFVYIKLLLKSKPRPFNLKAAHQTKSTLFKLKSTHSKVCIKALEKEFYVETTVRRYFYWLYDQSETKHLALLLSC